MRHSRGPIARGSAVIRHGYCRRKGAVWSTVALLALIHLIGLPTLAGAQTQTAVEYYYADWNFYFVTSFPDEIAALDAGSFGGVWKRTGQTFAVWTSPTNGALPACRFFSTIFAPKSSHFYTPYPNECAALKASDGWQYEAIAFYVLLPDADGNCPEGTEILYRLYDNGMGGAPNHRFIRSKALFQQMQGAGWSFEGNGLTGAYACVPSSPPDSLAAEGQWAGSLGSGDRVFGIVLDTGEFYFALLNGALSGGIGVLRGDDYSSINRSFSSSARFFWFSGSVYSVTVNGSYDEGSYLSASVDAGTPVFHFNADYQSSYEQPIDLATISGTYTATNSQGSLAFTLDSTGSVTGSYLNCALTGTAMPHGGVGVLNVTLTPAGDCVVGGKTLKGAAFFSAPTTLMLFASDSADAYMWFVADLNVAP